MAHNRNHTASVMANAVNSNSLSMIADYGSSDEEDDVPGGIGVQTKRGPKDEEMEVEAEQEQRTSEAHGRPRKRLKGVRRLGMPPTPELHNPAPSPVSLPNPLRDSAAADTEWTDDPSAHGGRVRSFPHVRGNWATYVYARPKGLERRLGTVQADLCNALHLEPVDSPHLSLTRVVTIRHHWIDSFVAGVREVMSGTVSFPVALGGLEVFINEEETRTFVGLSAEAPELLKAVGGLDSALGEFNLPPFYNPAKFHISVAWCLGNKKADLEKAIGAVNPSWTSSELALLIEGLEIKCGDKTFAIPFSSR